MAELNVTGRNRGKKKSPDPTPEQVEKWASQGLTRKQMAVRLGVGNNYFNEKINRSRELIRAELRGKLKYYE